MLANFCHAVPFTTQHHNQQSARQSIFEGKPSAMKVERFASNRAQISSDPTETTNSVAGEDE
jgi:hypothetical protein